MNETPDMNETPNETLPGRYRVLKLHTFIND